MKKVKIILGTISTIFIVFYSIICIKYFWYLPQTGYNIVVFIRENLGLTIIAFLNFIIIMILFSIKK